MTEEQLSDLLEGIQNKEYELGKIVATEEMANDLMELASNAFVVNDDKIASYLRNLSNGISEKAKDARKTYNEKYQPAGQRAIDELHKKCVKP